MGDTFSNGHMVLNSAKLEIMWRKQPVWNTNIKNKHSDTVTIILVTLIVRNVSYLTWALTIYERINV